MIKRALICMMIVMCFSLSACNNTKTINGKVYDVYGLANKETKYNPKIRYEKSIGSVIAAVLLVETLIVPIYVILFDLYQPVDSIDNNFEPGVVSK